MHNSLEYWRTTPSTAAALFSVEMPYRPPKSRVGAFLWRRRMWLETTMGLSVLEPWEKLMICASLVSFPDILSSHREKPWGPRRTSKKRSAVSA
ncbi:hypothetical protein PsYK624_101630 [Phanerochaete sordida]|uniref:Uncharacterized protein n=1 Tax=Phanerochaete sordida TaxID=48140 RepID=A0A9P3GFM3_9APHY|nr:hypothetical protein PsYK624_101630 [Phanerochaete sordida]